MITKRFFIAAAFIIVNIAGCQNAPKNETRAQTATKKTVPDFYEQSRQLILNQNKIGRTFSVKEHLDTGINEVSLRYLGTIKMRSGRTIKFLNSINHVSLINDVEHASAIVCLYDTANNMIGNYYVGGDFDVPTSIQGGDLVFAYDNKRCSQTTRISFLDSIPKQIFINCTEKGGDLYSFQEGNVDE